MSRRSLAAALVAATALAAPAAAEAKQQLYVSLGDSYASGWEAVAEGKGKNTTNGFAYQVPAAAKQRGYDLKLVNFGCGGATTTSVLTAKGCAAPRLGVKGQRYDGKTQVAAAEAFLRKNKGKVALITVSIGGNDVTRCAKEADPVPCVGAASASIKKNVTALAKRLRKAAGPKVQITGITYPDVILGEHLKGDSGKQLASLSTIAFQSIINPALKDAYAAAKGSFVDVTAATGAYGSMDETKDVAGYGTLPKPVAAICELTYYCAYGDIHANRAGYGIIADLVATTLKRR